MAERFQHPLRTSDGTDVIGFGAHRYHWATGGLSGTISPAHVALTYEQWLDGRLVMTIVRRLSPDEARGLAACLVEAANAAESAPARADEDPEPLRLVVPEVVATEAQ
jgi:hypothetical protein